MTTTIIHHAAEAAQGIDYTAPYAAAWIGVFGSGLAAAIAAWLAWRVARRQIEIQDQQREILKRQVDLQELTVREALFKRRWQFYRALTQYIEDVQYQQNPDAMKLDEGLFKATRKAAFLFPQSVQSHIDALAFIGQGLLSIRRQMADPNNPNMESLVRSLPNQHRKFIAQAKKLEWEIHSHMALVLEDNPAEKGWLATTQEGAKAAAARQSS